MAPGRRHAQEWAAGQITGFRNDIVGVAAANDGTAEYAASCADLGIE
ncbi:hypothetical protein SAMN05421539_1232 [Jannaschia seohaensis]|uniref:Uncharacterized protein n=1 Tax=Jannaschia seohaensis TaxID=475081 RepID=A0A2Y9B5D4_9RHOB|nr:hypothetical protein BCF38_1232 [Jannaschia seohaensis]SSA51631.1 hypothetical protein SAMN05421539_1232 [Jannaschia seohaensis]